MSIVELGANPMLLVTYIVVGIFITAIILGTWFGWRIIRDDSDRERAMLKIELVKSFFSGLGTLIVAFSLITGISTYLKKEKNWNAKLRLIVKNKIRNSLRPQ